MPFHSPFGSNRMMLGRHKAFCVLLVFHVTVSHAQDHSIPEAWFRNSLVGMEVGPTGAHFGNSDPTDTRYCAAWDGAEIVRACAAAGAEYVVLWLRDGDFAYYDSKLLTKAPGLKSRDPLRDAIAEAKVHSLPIISYCVVQQGGNFMAEHPEWKMRDARGNEIGRFCFNSGYLEAMKRIVAEQLALGVDGFHIDMLDQGFGEPYGCWCETCQQLFRDEYGQDMPREIAWDESWSRMLDFRYETSDRFEKQLAAHIKSLDPEATVDFNYHGNPPFSFEVGQRPVQHAGNGDFVTGETGVWGFSALGVGLNAEFYRAANPGVPFQVAIQRGVRMYHDQTTRPLHDLRWETLTLLAHGAFVTMIDKTAFDGSLDPVAYRRMGEVLREARSLRIHFGQSPVFELGLYFSSRTRDWLGRENPEKYFQSFLGAHAACAMEHIQYGVLFDEDLTLEKMQRFPAICLPNVAILSTPEVELLRDYVHEGGKLLVTGQTGQFDAMGKPLAKSVIDDLIGARVTKRLPTWDNWISVGAFPRPNSQTGDYQPDLPETWPFLVAGPATVYEPTTANFFGSLHPPHRTTRQNEGRMGTDWPMSPDISVGPAVLVHDVGKGRVVTCSGSPDFASASEHALVEDRLLFRFLFDALETERRVQIEAPSNVEAIVTDDSETRTLRVHLLCYNSTPRPTPSINRPYTLPGLIEDRPIFRTAISGRGLREASALDPTTRVVTESEGEQLQVDVTTEDVHEVILLRY